MVVVIEIFIADIAPSHNCGNVIHIRGFVVHSPIEALEINGEIEPFANACRI